MPTLDDALPMGTRIDEFEIIDVLGRGGFGITYRAHDHNLNRLAALKEYMPDGYATRRPDRTVVPSSEATRRTFEWGLDRFSIEAQTLAKFRHPNIVYVQRLLNNRLGTAFFVMDYLKGDNLNDAVMRDGPYKYDDFKDIFSQLLDGCEAIHKVEILHRDIKPLNIMLAERSKPILIDFGAVGVLEVQKKRALSRIYADGYSPKEQYSEEQPQGPYTDIYALAATAYFALSGQDPRSAPARMAGDHLPSLAQVARTPAPEAFCKAIDWALQLEIADRPVTIAEWRAKMPELTPNVVVVQGVRISRRSLILGGGAVGGIATAGVALYEILAPAPAPDLSTLNKPLRVTSSKMLGSIPFGTDPYAGLALRGTDAIVTSGLGADKYTVRLAAMTLDDNLDVVGEVFRADYERSYGRAVVPLEDGSILIGGLANQTDVASETYVARVNRDGTTLWQYTFGDGALNAIAYDSANQRILFCREGFHLGKISVITILDLNGRQIGQDLEMGRMADESVEQLLLQGDGVIVLNFHNRSHGETSAESSIEINRFHIVSGEVQPDWSTPDVSWMTENHILQSQPHSIALAVGDVFYAGRAKPNKSPYDANFQACASYLGRIGGSDGKARWRKVGSLDRAAPDPFSAIKWLAVCGAEQPRLYAAEFFQQKSVSRIVQLDGDGQVINALLIGSAQDPFIVDKIALNDDGGYAIGFMPRPNDYQLVAHRLVWA